MFKNGIEFFKQHIFLANLSHLTGGFGLAVVLQHYVAGNPFFPVVIGWLMLGFSLAVHAIAYAKGGSDSRRSGDET